MADEKMVKVTGLRRTYGKDGKYYGPGDAEMPESLAQSLGYLDENRSKRPAKQPPNKVKAKKKASE